jgi:ribonuclease HI
MSIPESENSEPLAPSVNADNISTTPLEEIYHLHIYQSWQEMEVPARRSCSTASPNTFPKPYLASFRHPHLQPGHESASLKEYIYCLPQWHRRLLSQWKQEATDLQIWRSFRSRQRITIASDGGLKHRMGTQGWKIVSRSQHTLFSGSGPVDGPFDISHSTRSELGGLTAPLLLVQSLAKFWGLNHKCRYRWLTDSKAAISRVTIITTPNFSPRRYPDDVDYVTAIRELHRSLGGRKLRPMWIKGHQDEDKSYDDLSRDARLNVDADQLASDHFWSGKGTRPPQPRLTSTNIA